MTVKIAISKSILVKNTLDIKKSTYFIENFDFYLQSEKIGVKLENMPR
jgi:hypothetical protein